MHAALPSGHEIVGVEGGGAKGSGVVEGGKEGVTVGSTRTKAVWQAVVHRQHAPRAVASEWPADWSRVIQPDFPSGHCTCIPSHIGSVATTKIEEADATTTFLEATFTSAFAGFGCSLTGFDETVTFFSFGAETVADGGVGFGGVLSAKDRMARACGAGTGACSTGGGVALG